LSVMSIASSLAIFVEIDVGVTTVTASGGFVFVARIKKDNSRKATSHIAVISTAVLFLGNLTFGIIENF